MVSVFVSFKLDRDVAIRDQVGSETNLKLSVVALPSFYTSYFLFEENKTDPCSDFHKVVIQKLLVFSWAPALSRRLLCQASAEQ